MSIRKLLLVAVAAATALLGAPLAAAADSSMAGGDSRAYLGARNLPAHGVALEGYSPVSYFEGRAERGSALFAVEHEGVTYHLTDARQVAAFRQSPGRYAPAFGGWCAFGMSIEDKFPVDPTNFAIVDGQLMLFLRNDQIDALALWRQGDEKDLTRKARAHWRKVSN